MAKRKNLALRKNKSEVIAMSIFEYDKEEEERKLRKAEYEAGREEGIKEGTRGIVRNMLQAGEPMEKIARYYYLPHLYVQKTDVHASAVVICSALRIFS